MAEYHVGCGLFGIYAGTLKAKTPREWKNKTECTNEALCACAQYLFDNNKEFRFEQKGKMYAMRIEELKDGENIRGVYRSLESAKKDAEYWKEMRPDTIFHIEQHALYD